MQLFLAQNLYFNHFPMYSPQKEGRGEDDNQLKVKTLQFLTFSCFGEAFLFLHLRLILLTLARAFHFHHLSTIRLHLLFILLAKQPGPHLWHLWLCFCPATSFICSWQIWSLSNKCFNFVRPSFEISCTVANSNKKFRIARTGLISVANCQLRKKSLKDFSWKLCLSM